MTSANSSLWWFHRRNRYECKVDKGEGERDFDVWWPQFHLCSKQTCLLKDEKGRVNRNTMMMIKTRPKWRTHWGMLPSCFVPLNLMTQSKERNKSQRIKNSQKNSIHVSAIVENGETLELVSCCSANVELSLNRKWIIAHVSIDHIKSSIKAKHTSLHISHLIHLFGVELRELSMMMREFLISQLGSNNQTDTIFIREEHDELAKNSERVCSKILSCIVYNMLGIFSTSKSNRHVHTTQLNSSKHQKESYFIVYSCSFFP